MPTKRQKSSWKKNNEGLYLDACALIALLNDESGAQRVEAIISGDEPVYMSAINALEVAYDAVRRSQDNGAAALILRVVIDAITAIKKLEWHYKLVILV